FHLRSRANDRRSSSSPAARTEIAVALERHADRRRDRVVRVVQRFLCVLSLRGLGEGQGGGCDDGHHRDRKIARVHRTSTLEISQPLQSTHARHEKVLAALEHVEGFDAVNATPHWLPRNSERGPFPLPPDDRVALVAGPDEIAVVAPL